MFAFENFLIVKLGFTHLLDKRFVIKALTANWLVEVLTANNLESLRATHTECETSVLVAIFADCLELLDFLSLRDKLENTLKASS